MLFSIISSGYAVLLAVRGGGKKEPCWIGEGFANIGVLGMGVEDTEGDSEGTGAAGWIGELIGLSSIYEAVGLRLCMTE